MNIFKLTCFLLLFHLFKGQAQNTSPQILLKSDDILKLCTMTDNAIAADIVGVFNAGNQFTVHITNAYGGDIIASYPATYHNGAFHFKIDKDIVPIVNLVRYQISTSSPILKVESRNFANLYNQGSVTLQKARGTSDTLNPGANRLINFDITSNGTLRLVLSDSSQLEQSSGFSYPTSIPIRTQKDLFIVRATNACNVPVPSSGKVTTTNNSILIIPGRILNKAVCSDGQLDLSYYVSGGTLPATATFKLRLLRVSEIDADQMDTFEVPAVRKAEGILTAKIPAAMIKKTQVHQVAIVVSNPRLVSPYTPFYTISQKPTVSFYTDQVNVLLGDSYRFGVNVSGSEASSVTFTNGQTYDLSVGFIKIEPKQTETFEIKSIETACGVISDLPKKQFTVNVSSGIRIKSRENTTTICENTLVRLPVAYNIPINSSTKFTVEGKTENNKNYTFEAKLVNDSLEFRIPSSPLEWEMEGYFRIQGFRVITANPAHTSEYTNGFMILGMPRVKYQTSEPTTLPFPSYTWYTIDITGGTPYQSVDHLGGTINSIYSSVSKPIFVPKTGNYGLQSVKNACFSNTNPAKLDLTVKPYTGTQPLVIIHPANSTFLCEPDSIEVNFEALGNFDPENEFQIMLPSLTEKVWKTVKKAGKYKFPITEYTERQPQVIRSTKPVGKWEAGFPVLIGRKPKILPQAEIGSKASNPVIFTSVQNPHITVPMETGSWEPQYPSFDAVFSDGNENYTISESTFFPSIEKGKIVTYTLKSIANQCGFVEVNRSYYLYWAPFELSFGRTYEITNCSGEEFTLPFKIETGTAPIGTEYQLQIATESTEFKTISTSQSVKDGFKYKIPANMESGRYRLRAISGDYIKSSEVYLVVKNNPTGQLVVRDYKNDIPTEITFGDELKLEYKLTGGGPWDVVTHYVGQFEETIETPMRIAKIDQETLFKISSISNICGYGTVSGEFLVKVKPKVLLVKPEISSICSGGVLKVEYLAGGDIAAGENIGFYLTNSTGVRINFPKVSANKGTISLPLSAELRAGNYTLTCYIEGTDASLSQPIQIRHAPALELSGQSTINAGQATYLQIAPSEEGYEEILIKLSDGSQENARMWYPANHNFRVSPTVTTTYTITSAVSSCGPLKTSGSATVVVNPPSNKSINIQAMSHQGYFCSKDSIYISFKKTGTFTTSNQFSVQILDLKGQLVYTAKSSEKESPLSILVPNNLTPGSLFWFRVVATDPNTASSDFQLPLRLSSKATASFTHHFAHPDSDGQAQLIVQLGGTGPWSYSYMSSQGIYHRNPVVSPDTVIVNTNQQGSSFQIRDILNACGVGSILEPSNIKIEVVLGAEDSPMSLISIGPNPTTKEILIHFPTGEERNLFLFNQQGTTLWQEKLIANTRAINMELYPSGIYILKVIYKQQVSTFKIVKY